MKRAWLALVVALIAIAASVGLYFLVAQPEPAEDARIDPGVLQEFRWQSWSSEAFQRAQSEDRLVFLLVTNPLVPAATELQKQIEEQSSLTVLLANRVTSVLVDRRVRPDIAERYAEDLSYQAMLLLPTGEALMVLDGDMNDWPKQITETDRYWRDHREDIQSRVESFWTEYEESLKQLRAPRKPQESDLEIIDRHVRELAEAAIKNEAMGIWRVDVSEYLMLRGLTETWAHELCARIHDVRVNKRLENPEIWDSFTSEGRFRLLLDSERWHRLTGRAELRTPEAHGPKPIPVSDLVSSVLTSADIAAAGLNPQSTWPGDYAPGTWISQTTHSGYSLPHVQPSTNPLDGYLSDALAWLEYLETDTASSRTTRAAALADSIWDNLWSHEANALRDKPLRDTPVREIELFPRPQLGRAAYLLDALAEQTGDPRFRARADSCLAGFAPYVEDAGAAAAYYGIALLKRYSHGS